MGSGFCPILSRRERRDGARRAPPFGGGLPRAMLAPDASVGKTEKIVTLPYAAKYSWLQHWFRNVILPIAFYLIPASQFLNRVAGNPHHINAEEKSRLACAESLNSRPEVIRNC